MSGELQSYNMLCQGCIKNQNCSPVSYSLDPLELLTRWQKKLGRSGVPAGLTRGRKEVGQVAKEEELDQQGSDTDSSLDSDDDTMVAWEEEESE